MADENVWNKSTDRIRRVSGQARGTTAGHVQTSDDSAAVTESEVMANFNPLQVGHSQLKLWCHGSACDTHEFYGATC